MFEVTGSSVPSWEGDGSTTFPCCPTPATNGISFFSQTSLFYLVFTPSSLGQFPYLCIGKESLSRKTLFRWVIPSQPQNTSLNACIKNVLFSPIEEQIPPCVNSSIKLCAVLCLHSTDYFNFFVVSSGGTLECCFITGLMISLPESVSLLRSSCASQYSIISIGEQHFAE